MRTIPFAVVLLVVLGCGDDGGGTGGGGQGGATSTGGAGEGGAGEGGAGGGGALTEIEASCADLCDRYDEIELELECAYDDPACEATCEAAFGSVVGCEAEALAVNDCFIAQPVESWTCFGADELALTGTECSDEVVAQSNCVSGGAGGGGGA